MPTFTFLEPLNVRKNSAEVLRLLGDLFLLSCMDDPDVITEVLGHYKKRRQETKTRIWSGARI